jgi:endonuclease/exonuclease/phosphatase family metal-dependent hydrolase
MSRFRVMTYNVHRCIGRGGRDSTEDITRVIADANPDLVALQELDAPETDDDEGAHHARDIARSLGMTLLFCRTFRRDVGFYGHALLSRSPIELKRATTFAAFRRRGISEPRGAIWARATIGQDGRVIDIVSTHLGVARPERQHQSNELIGETWLGSPEMGPNRILCGDLNAVPRAMTYRRIAQRGLRDAQLLPATNKPRRRFSLPKPTFPSAFPILRLDHVFVSEPFSVNDVIVPHDAVARRASDHLPLVVDLEL